MQRVQNKAKRKKDMEESVDKMVRDGISVVMFEGRFVRTEGANCGRIWRKRVQQP